MSEKEKIVLLMVKKLQCEWGTNDNVFFKSKISLFLLHIIVRKKEKMCFVESKAIVVQDGDKGRGSVIQFLSPPKF